MSDGLRKLRRMHHTLRLVRLVAAAFAVSIQQELANRANLAVHLAMTGLGIAGSLGALAALYSHTQQLAGWRLGEMLILGGTFALVNALLRTFVEPNLEWFAERIRTGMLDDALLQPVPSLFAASFGTCRPLGLISAVTGATFISAGLLAVDDAIVTPANVLAYPLLVLAGTVVAWAFRLLLACVAFWAHGLELSVFYSGIWQLGSAPVDVYAAPIRALLTYVVPVAYVSTFPARALTRGADPLVLLGGLAAAAGSAWVASLVWQAGLRRYTSATS